MSGFLGVLLHLSFNERIAVLYRRLSPSAHSAFNRYGYPVYQIEYGHPSSLIQIAEFSESPLDCPARDPKGLDAHKRGALAEQNSLQLTSYCCYAFTGLRPVFGFFKA